MKRGHMASIEEQILRTTKEIIVKFIEVGRVYPTSFHDTFVEVYHTVDRTVRGLEKPVEKGDQQKKKK